jgi:hypothetical protein
MVRLPWADRRTEVDEGKEVKEIREVKEMRKPLLNGACEAEESSEQ